MRRFNSVVTGRHRPAANPEATLVALRGQKWQLLIVTLLLLGVALLLLVGAVAFATVAFAELDGNPGTTPLSVTSTSQSVTFASARSTLAIENDDATNEVYVRLFACGDTIVAATTTTGKEIKAMEKMSITHNTRTQPGLGWCGFSIICAAAETASVRWKAE